MIPCDCKASARNTQLSVKIVSHEEMPRAGGNLRVLLALLSLRKLREYW